MLDPRWQALLPQRALSRAVGRLGRAERPRWLVRAVLRWFARRYRVDLEEASRPLDAYSSFTAFFTRRLAAGRRPLPADPDRLVSPADGTVANHGTVIDGALIQAKGIDYPLARLLGDPALAAAFAGGSYLTVYLSPRDYHRVHAPFSGVLHRRLHRPGRLYSVSADTVARIPGVFADNERVVLVFDDPALGRWALVLVGALIVGGIETVWEGTVNPPPRGAEADRRFADGPRVARGDEVGLFRAGSTVIAVFTAGRATLAVQDGAPLRLGEAIGERRGATPEAPAP